MGLLKKIKRTVRKIVPKEVSGIMRAAAPFVSAQFGLPAGLATSLAGQLRSGRGRINPFSTLAAIAPSQAFRQFTTGARGIGSFQLDPTGRVAQLGQGLDKFLYGMSDAADMKRAQGLFGFAGDFKPLQGNLLAPGGTLSKPRLAALAATGVSLAAATKQIEEEAVEEGVSDSEIDILKAEAADFWSTLSSSDFAVTPTLAKGGRVGFAEGTDKNIPDNPKSRDMASLAKLKDFVNLSNYFMNRRETDDFQTMQKERFMYDYEPKMPEKMLDKIRKLLDKDDRQASAILGGEEDDIAMELFGKPYKDLTPAEIQEFQEEMDRLQKKFMKKDFKNRTIAAKGGIMRQNLALGTRPTAQESGLGGLPIEADMRYSGGFMPYGAKEKADDVPARLSKNEFVFTADAVRAAGGGSVQKGAQRMYNTMKQLEAMGRS